MIIDNDNTNILIPVKHKACKYTMYVHEAIINKVYVCPFCAKEFKLVKAKKKKK